MALGSFRNIVGPDQLSGEVNNPEQFVKYTGIDSTTSTVIVNNETRQIGVQVKPTAVNNILDVKVNNITVVDPADKIAKITLNKAAVGLGNVDNTSDVNKPISTATQAALNLKSTATNLENGTGINSLKQKNNTNFVYGSNSVLFGSNITIGSSEDATKGIGTVSFGVGTTFKVADFVEGEKPDARKYLINIKSTGQVPELSSYSYQQIIAGEADNIELNYNYILGNDSFNKGGNRVSGSDNTVFGRYNFVGNNTTHNFITGNQNLCVGNDNIVGGLLNYVASGINFVFGHKNETGHQFSFVGGEGNQTAAANQTLFGKYANATTNTVFAVGNGTTSGRSNVFELLADGTGKLNNKNIATTDLIHITAEDVVIG